MSKKATTLSLLKKKAQGEIIQMLTCYDFQTAQLLNETPLDLILVGDSLGNVVLGYETTLQVTLNDMITFAAAVKRGAPDKFIVADMPFGSYSSVKQGLKNATKLLQATAAESVKIEGAAKSHCKLIKRMTENGIAVMGHIGLRPQSVHQMGGYYTHGKSAGEEQKLLEEALALQEAGAFAIVLECIQQDTASTITQTLSIPTIGIGSGQSTNGQVLVINDLLKMGRGNPPKFCKPIANFYNEKKQLISQYLGSPLQ